MIRKKEIVCFKYFFLQENESLKKFLDTLSLYDNAIFQIPFII